MEFLFCNGLCFVVSVHFDREKVPLTPSELATKKFPCYTIENKRKGKRRAFEESMKYIINQVSQGEDELILNYVCMSAEVERVLAFMKKNEKRVLGFKNGQQTILKPEEIFYVESVDGRTYVYTEIEVYKINHSLAEMQEVLSSINFYRCSKSMIINIDCISSLKSLSSNRIDATMKNGEHILISRTYASEFRRRLRGE